MKRHARSFDGVCLDMTNVNTYLREKCKGITCEVKTVKLLNDCYHSGLLQKDYGKDMDCTLTSITDLLMMKFQGIFEDTNAAYKEVEAVASAYGYNGDKTGTNPLTINSIMKQISLNHKIPCKTKAKYVKELPFIGWNKDDIIKNIQCGVPVILNIFKDGRKYYDNHTILVVGYCTYIVGDEEITMLLVHDNWHKNICLVDYDLLCISSINYLFDFL